MSRSTVSKDRILACRLTDVEERAVDNLAKAAGVSPARFLRDAVLERVRAAECGTPTLLRPSWAEEFVIIDSLDVPERIARFNKLRAGRPIPHGFLVWHRDQQVAWLDKEWPL